MFPDSKTEEWESIRIPTVFIVNLTSYSFLDASLDVLQRQNNIAVVLDNSSPSPGDLIYTEKIRTRINGEMLLSTDGALGGNPDAILKNIPMKDLVNISETVLKNKSLDKKNRTAFNMNEFGVSRPEVNSSSLTREQKIMGLMKIWVNVNNFYAYPENITMDWKNMLQDWIPEVEKTGNLEDYYSVLMEATVKLNDNHIRFRSPSLPISQWFWSTETPPKTIPAWFAKVQDKVIVMQVDSAALPQWQLNIGDELLAIDGKTISEIEAYWRKRISAAQESGFLRNVWEYAFAIRGTKDSIVTILVQGKYGKKEIQLKKTENTQRIISIHPFGRKLVEKLPGNIGYIQLYRTSSAEFDSALHYLKDTKGLIFDLRVSASESGGAGRTDFVNHLIKEPFKFRGPKKTYHFSDGGPVRARGDVFWNYFPDPGENIIRYFKPIVVIINSRQQSSGEGAMQVLQTAKRVSFVGSSTVGTNGGNNSIRLPDGGRFSFTMQQRLTPDGLPFHGIGIVPDVKIKPTIQGIRARKDEVLEKAIEVLNKKIKMEKN